MQFLTTQRQGRLPGHLKEDNMLSITDSHNRHVLAQESTVSCSYRKFSLTEFCKLLLGKRCKILGKYWFCLHTELGNVWMEGFKNGLLFKSNSGRYKGDYCGTDFWWKLEFFTQQFLSWLWEK